MRLQLYWVGGLSNINEFTHHKANINCTNTAVERIVIMIILNLINSNLYGILYQIKNNNNNNLQT